MKIAGIKFKNEIFNYDVPERKITLQQLKEVIMCYNAPWLEREREGNTKIWKENIDRKLIRADLKDCYGSVCTTVFSIEGSTPWGRAILVKPSYSNNDVGKIIFIGNKRNSKQYYFYGIK